MFLQPVQTLPNRHLLGGRCIVSPHGKQTVCRLLNPTDQELVVQKGLVVAMASSVLPSDVTPRETPNTNQQTATSNPPPTYEEAVLLAKDLGISLEKTKLTKQQKHRP